MRVLPKLSAKEQETASQENTERIADDEIELPLFDLITISNATNQFSFANKIGEGGFGPVYQVVSVTYPLTSFNISCRPFCLF